MRLAKQREVARVRMCFHPCLGHHRTFNWVFPNTDAQSEMQLVATGFSCRCWNAGSLLVGDSCWQSETQLASGSPDVERRIATCHGHICRTSAHIFPGARQMQANTLHIGVKGTHTRKDACVAEETKLLLLKLQSSVRCTFLLFFLYFLLHRVGLTDFFFRIFY